MFSDICVSHHSVVGAGHARPAALPLLRVCLTVQGRACPARGLAFAARLPYSAGPGMPGPYAVVVISQTA